MLDFRLKVFLLVCKHLNFSKAAEELFISQPAVSKHIHEIEAFYQSKLFTRKGTRISLTPAGYILYRHAQEIFTIHRNIEMQLASLNQEYKGTLHIGASTTAAQYFLPAALASFKAQYPKLKIYLSVNNTQNIENMLLEHKINLAILEGHSKRKDLKYSPLIKDHMVLCCSAKNSYPHSAPLELKALLELPLIIREAGSGSRQVVLKALKDASIQPSLLHIDMEFESTESIKSYLLNSNSFAFLSIGAITNELKSGTLKTIDVKGLHILRDYHYVTEQGENQQLNELFFKHLKAHCAKA